MRVLKLAISLAGIAGCRKRAIRKFKSRSIFARRKGNNRIRCQSFRLLKIKRRLFMRFYNFANTLKEIYEPRQRLVSLSEYYNQYHILKSIHILARYVYLCNFKFNINTFVIYIRHNNEIKRIKRNNDPRYFREFR